MSFPRREASQVGDDAADAVGPVARVEERLLDFDQTGQRLRGRARLQHRPQAADHLPRIGDVADDRRERVVDLVPHSGRERADRGQPLGVMESLLDLAPLGDVAEDQYATEDVASVVDDGSSAVVDRVLTPTADEEIGVRRELDREALARTELQVPLQRLPLSVHEAKDLAERATDRVARAPSGERLRHGVHERDALRAVGRDDGVADRLQRGGEPALAFGEPYLEHVLVERDLDRGA